MKRYISILFVLVVMMFCSWNLVFANGEPEEDGEGTEAGSKEEAFQKSSPCHECSVFGLAGERQQLHDDEKSSLSSCINRALSSIREQQRTAHIPSAESKKIYIIEAHAWDKGRADIWYFAGKIFFRSLLHESVTYRAPDVLNNRSDEKCCGVVIRVCRADGGWLQHFKAEFHLVRDDKEEEGEKPPKNDLAAQQKAYVAAVEKQIKGEDSPAALHVGKQEEEGKDKKDIQGGPSASAPHCLRCTIDAMDVGSTVLTQEEATGLKECVQEAVEQLRKLGPLTKEYTFQVVASGHETSFSGQTAAIMADLRCFTAQRYFSTKFLHTLLKAGEGVKILDQECVPATEVSSKNRFLGIRVCADVPKVASAPQKTSSGETVTDKIPAKGLEKAGATPTSKSPEPQSVASGTETEKLQEMKPPEAKSPESASKGASGTGGDEKEMPDEASPGLADFSISTGYAVHIPFNSGLESASFVDDPLVDSFASQHGLNAMLHLGVNFAEDWMLLFSLGGGYGNRNLDGFFGIGVQAVFLFKGYLFFLPGVNVRAFHPDREEVFLQGRQITTVVGLGDCFLGSKLCAEFLYEVGDMVESFPIQQGGKEAVSSFGMGFYPRVRYKFYSK